MGDVVSLNDHNADTVEWLKEMPDAAKDLDARGAIVLLVLDDDSVAELASHDYSFASISGYMMHALVHRVVDEANEE